MGLANNLNKFEWENEIPFPETLLKRTVHAMIGEPVMIYGLIKLNEKWNLNCVNPENNDTFGSYSFGQVNSTFSVTVKKVDEQNSNLKVLVAERQGAFITGNQAYLQSECDKFIKALSYYLEHPNEVENWYAVKKPELEKEAKEAAKSAPGCGAITLIIIIGGTALGLLFAWLFL